MMDFGGRGAAGSDDTAATFGSGLAARGSAGGLPPSPLLRCWSAMGSAGYRPELLRRSISLILTSPIRARRAAPSIPESWATPVPQAPHAARAPASAGSPEPAVPDP